MITLVAMNWDRIFMRWTSLMNAKGSVHWILTHVCTQEATAHSLSCSFPVSSFPTHSKGQTPLSLLSVRLVWLILESYKCSYPVRHSCAWLFRLRVMLVRLIWVTVFWKIFISFVCVCADVYTWVQVFLEPGRVLWSPCSWSYACLLAIWHGNFEIWIWALRRTAVSSTAGPSLHHLFSHCICKRFILCILVAVNRPVCPFCNEKNFRLLSVWGYPFPCMLSCLFLFRFIYF